MKVDMKQTIQFLTGKVRARPEGPQTNVSIFCSLFNAFSPVLAEKMPQEQSRDTVCPVKSEKID